MNDIPKSVRDGLARQQQPGASHPDADLLTAYSEGTVTERERAQIQQHLAICSDCREIVFLSAPAQQPAPAAATVKPKTRWFPVWVPWAATAAILVSATFLLTHRGSEGGVQESAKLQTTVSPADKSTPSTPATIAAEPTASQPAANEKSDTTRPAATKSAPNKAQSEAREDNSGASQAQEAKRVAAKDALSKKAEDADRLSADAQSGLTAPAAGAAPAAVYAQRNTSLKPGPAAPAQNQMVTNRQQNQVAQNNPASASQSVEVTSAAAQVSPVPSDIASFEADTRIPAKAKVASRAHWRISAEGAVERTSAGLPWTAALTYPGSKFTIVAVIGDTIWAGGTNGVLFRSTDSGNHWAQIHLPGLAARPDEVITRIDFRDAKSGTVSTSGGYAWTTTDGGESWKSK